MPTKRCPNEVSDGCVKRDNTLGRDDIACARLLASRRYDIEQPHRRRYTIAESDQSDFGGVCVVSGYGNAKRHARIGFFSAQAHIGWNYAE
jgi:hypothetical protein